MSERNRVVVKQRNVVKVDVIEDCERDEYGVVLTSEAHYRIEEKVDELVAAGKMEIGYYDCEILDESTGDVIGSEILVA